MTPNKKTSLIAGMTLCLLILWPVSRLHSQFDSVAEIFLNNVVHIFDGDKSGFGFVVAEERGNLYVATAGHVVFPDDPDAEPDIQVRFNERKGKSYPGTLLDLSYSGVDLALLEVPKPFKNYKWERRYFHPRPKRNDEVWFIGRGNDWYIPTNKATGRINTQPIAGKIHVDMYSVQVGTSGAPLISEKGIVGMIIEDEGADVVAVDIDTIRRVITQVWRYPWHMEDFSASDGKIAVARKPDRKAASTSTSSSSTTTTRATTSTTRPTTSTTRAITTTTRPTTSTTRATTTTTTIPSAPRPRISNSLGMEFVYIPPGEFMMGSPENEPGRDDDEKQHKVILTKGFYMQTTEVTQGQWKAVMGDNPSYFKNWWKGDDYPVETVSWDDVQGFIKKLNRKEGKDKYRLPTEAEWEYAARSGGKAEKYAGFSDDDRLHEYANFCDKNCEHGWKNETQDDKYGNTAPVGSYKPNGLGLYDMSGNVWEWCQDWYGDYPPGSVSDPGGPSTGSIRVLRGGSWDFRARNCRAAVRDWFNPGDRDGYVGFRLVMEAP